LIFLWDWAGRLGPSTARLAFRLTQVLWILLVPLLILLGLADRWISAAPGVAARLYGAIATYHADLEFPVLLALILSPHADLSASQWGYSRLRR
jgi:hypothetical protein